LTEGNGEGGVPLVIKVFTCDFTNNKLSRRKGQETTATHSLSSSRSVEIYGWDRGALVMSERENTSDDIPIPSSDLAIIVG
jgi:hypothetical protein